MIFFLNFLFTYIILIFEAICQIIENISVRSSGFILCELGIQLKTGLSSMIFHKVKF